MLYHHCFRTCYHEGSRKRGRIGTEWNMMVSSAFCTKSEWKLIKR